MHGESSGSPPFRFASHFSQMFGPIPDRDFALPSTRAGPEIGLDGQAATLLWMSGWGRANHLLMSNGNGCAQWQPTRKLIGSFQPMDL